MNKFLFFLIWISASTGLVTVKASGQERVVTGKVTAAGMFPVNKASVAVKKQNPRLLTDSTGVFTLTCGPEEKLVVSANGFVSETIDLARIEPTDTIRVNLALKKGEKNQSDAISAGHLTKENLEKVANMPASEPDYSRYRNITEIIEGRISGVSVGSNSINIRGAKLLNEDEVDALLVVDGTIVEFPVFIQIPTAEVKSVKVLKGTAAASLYGSRGMGGVILVTTKSGQN